MRVKSQLKSDRSSLYVPLKMISGSLIVTGWLGMCHTWPIIQDKLLLEKLGHNIDFQREWSALKGKVDNPCNRSCSRCVYMSNIVKTDGFQVYVRRKLYENLLHGLLSGNSMLNETLPTEVTLEIIQLMKQNYVLGDEEVIIKRRYTLSHFQWDKHWRSFWQFFLYSIKMV